MPDSVEIIFRTFTAFLLLWIFVLLLGKQTIAHKTYHLYIASITMGTIAGNLTFNIKIKFLYFILALFIMGGVVFILNNLAFRNQRYRKWIAGEPTTLIKKGQILEESMQKIGYTIDSLQQALRGKDIFNIEEVECAILEVNGTVSVLKKTEYQNTTKQDINVVPKSMVPATITDNKSVDGMIIGKLTQDETKAFIELEAIDTAINKMNISVSNVADFDAFLTRFQQIEQKRKAVLTPIYKRLKIPQEWELRTDYSSGDIYVINIDKSFSEANEKLDDEP
ncbi:DUF421 domain-containing protein [Neobacillus ginsengisoli]|uniref:Uncharacterized membrane protein YcaP (DUF421 family) n=1 Tax=Neobacillus ginsengisoli TaxID=904295 RepID=A0ABT9XUE6_9BACI|nr:YetF domain-containing protein [Neobacillus ginsengisoli]MDQ0199178.1 uncharacterized membrane protein YcaP (DUF421 family) [Neobacillus ginsengisoli]